MSPEDRIAYMRTVKTALANAKTDAYRLNKEFCLAPSIERAEAWAYAEGSRASCAETLVAELERALADVERLAMALRLS